MCSKTTVKCLLVSATSLLAVQLAGHISAQEIEGDVPLDLARALIADNTPFEARLYAGLPDLFPPIELPDSVELLGGADLGHSQRVVLRATGNGLAARSQIIRNLESADYLLLTTLPNTNPAQTGFVAPPQMPPTLPLQFCHDAYGMLTLRMTGNAGQAWSQPSVSQATVSQARVYQPTVPGTAVTPFFSSTTNVATGTSAAAPSASADVIIQLAHNGGLARGAAAMMGGMTCAQLQQQFNTRNQNSSPVLTLSQHMPRMELPDSATTSDMGMHTLMMGGTPGGLESRVLVQLDQELSTLFRHITEQIAEQGWQHDHDVIGELSASAGWTRQTNNFHLFGALRILPAGPDRYQLVFTLQPLPPD